MDRDTALLIIVTGRDRPGVTSRLSTVLAEHGARIADMEQVVLRGRLVLGIVVHVTGDTGGLQDAVFAVTGRAGMQCEIDVVEAKRMDRRDPVDRHHVTMLGMPLRPSAIASVTSAIADLGGNIDRIERLSRYPILSFELLVSGITDGASLKAAVGRAAAEEQVDVAVQRAGLHRRAKRLIVFDVDSTLVQDEVIELLAEEAGALDEVRRITEAAMAGELDFEASLRDRVRSLAGLDQAAIERAWQRLSLTPGARTFIRTLHALGYTTAIVSGGFTVFTDRLRAELGVGHAHANELEIVDGVLTGEVVGPIVDRARKAELLAHIAAAEGVPLEQTVAVGDGANDLDMLNLAGMGVAFNAKPVVAEAADTAIRVPYLDAILFLLGVRREDVEAAGLTEHVPIADT